MYMKSVQPFAISSIVRWPNPTHAVGSGFLLFVTALSKYDTVCSNVPAGNTGGVL